ncbi:hypothetical protein FPZ54_11080 [Sphingomonas suaedae]|uniref:Uncharacterized protein n=1 Tax=Sphingomonas suaedae TaxID=2599297 RepID=A0A518RGD6_9SPHN|nr:hypothetical protein [Sphingomonas suaedae]QDX26513.1 hypothetical protein FPZ54_11080 [Sphingomonas suaedae]
MTAVWIALGAVAIALVSVAISLNAAKTAKRKKDSGGDAGTTYPGDTDRHRTDNDWSGDSGGDGGGGD